MAKNISNQETTRRKILKWGSISSLALLFSSFKISKLISSKKAINKVISCGPATEPKVVKMLTQEGVLVEVDLAIISNASREKITDNQLQNWINKG